MLNVTVLNGGRGAASIIPALLHQQGLNVTSVVNAYDDGKSTGEIRRFFGMLGPSDIRKVQELMLPENSPDYQASRHVFQYRFSAQTRRADAMAQLRGFANASSGSLVGATFASLEIRGALRHFVRRFLDALSVIEKARGEEFRFQDCSVMNCIYAGAFLACDRNIELATRRIDRLFKLKGTVLPTSIEAKHLVALRTNGDMLYSEAEIVELRSNVRIERIYFLDSALDRERFERLTTEEKRRYLEINHCFVSVSQGVRHALQEADIIMFAPGTQHSSLYPTYLSTGLAAAIADNRSAFKVFVTNIGADYETPQYKASDYLLGAYKYLCLSDKRPFTMQELFDVILVNRSRFKRDETYVEFDEAAFGDIPVRRIVESFESAEQPGKHDGDAVVKKILTLYEASGPR